MKLAYIKWNDAFDLYNYGLYDESLEDYEKAYPVLKHNGEYLVNYGKALSISKKHEEAVEILELSKSYVQNTITYTALGDSYQKVGENNKTEQAYLKAHDMCPDQFSAQYLLVLYYESIRENNKIVDLA